MNDDEKIRIFLNTNITMSRGKAAAHAVHAALTAAGVHPGLPVVVLGAKPRDIEQMATSIHDEGRTELEPGTLTAGTDWKPDWLGDHDRQVSEKARRDALEEAAGVADAEAARCSEVTVVSGAHIRREPYGDLYWTEAARAIRSLIHATPTTSEELS